jgi:hypothetical protein
MSDLYDDEIEEKHDDKPLPRKTAEAQEQADEFGGFARSATVVAHKSGEKFQVPSVILLDDDQLIAYEKLHFELNQCDRWPDVENPKQRFVNKNPDGSEVETEIGAHTIRGDFIQPYQKDGALVEPPYSIQLAILFWGAEGYQRFKKGGGRSAEIPEKLRELNSQIKERSAADSKSAGSDGDLAAGADSDRS